MWVKGPVHPGGFRVLSPRKKRTDGLGPATESLEVLVVFSDVFSTAGEQDAHPGGMSSADRGEFLEDMLFFRIIIFIPDAPCMEYLK